MDRTIRHLLMSMLLVFAVAASAEEGSIQGLDVDVVGLFSGAAVLKIDGQRRLLKAGQRSAEGVILISADSGEAVIEYQGRQVTLELSNKVSSTYQSPEKSTVTIPRNDQGQYVTHGSINGRPVRLLVDTGANIVAMNVSTARELGVDMSTGTPMQANTAGGMRRSWQVTLEQVEVGDIRVHNVPAAVLEGGYPRQILLGMTFLQNVEISEKAGVLMLTSKL